MSKLFAFLRDESGATAIEYGLIAAGIAVVIITAVNMVGTSLNATFTTHCHEAEIILRRLLVRRSCHKRRLVLLCLNFWTRAEITTFHRTY